MSDETKVETREVLEAQIGNLRRQVQELNGILEVVGTQLQLCVQMALRHDWTLGQMTGGQLLDRDATAGKEGVAQVVIPVPHKDWVAILKPQKQSQILTAGGGRGFTLPPAPPPNGGPKLVTEG